MKKFLSVLLALAIVIGLLPAIAGFASAAEQADHVIIHAAFGGGGNSNAPYKNDYIVLYNPTNADVNLTGWSVQYTSKSGSFSSQNTTELSGTIAAGGYYLIQEAAGNNTSAAALPTPACTGTIAMGKDNFKLALVNETETITGEDDASVVDFLGTGTADDYEGDSAAPAPSNTKEVVRKQLGVDTDDNLADFTTGDPTPLNSSSAGGSGDSGNQGGGTGSENQGGSGSENQGGGTGTTPESDGYTYTKVIAANGLVTGYYTMVTSENIAPMVFDNGWVTKATPAFSEGNLINSYGAIWHLDVTGSTVKLTDINKVTIKPKSGNNNGIQSGSYDWAWTFANGTFSFSGTGDDTTTLAYNVQNAGFRAYKNKTIEDYSDDYLTDFTLYKVEGYTPPQPSYEEMTIPQAKAAAANTLVSVVGVVSSVSYNSVYIQDASGNAVLVYMTEQPGSALAVGETIIAQGKVGSYNGQPQISNGSYTKVTEESKKITLTALERATFNLANDYAGYRYFTTVQVIEVYDNNGEWSTPNITVEDAAGNKLQIQKAPLTKTEGEWPVKVGDILNITGTVYLKSSNGSYYNMISCTDAAKIEIVCSCTSDDLTWKTEGNQHWQECACGNRPISKCSTELETKYNDNKHWDECPDCDFATAELDHTMAPQKDATHHWTACACGKATDKVEHDLEYKSDETHHWQECKDCDHSTEATKEAHNFGTTYKKDAENHYLECVCGKQNDKGAHNDGDDADKLCDKCGLDMSCTHANGYKWNHDATSHWEECKDCGVEKAGTKAAHTLDGKFDADKHWKVCTNENCGYATEKVAHTMEPQKNDTHHWDACSCGKATDKVEHTMKPQKNDTHHWTECDCGHASEKVAHTMDTKKDDTHHWTECSCGHATDKVKHTLTAGKCTCGYAVSVNSSIKDALAGEKNNEFTVTGIVNLIDGKNVYIQDSTGGICIYLSAAPEGLKLGDTITATGKRDTYNGLPELVQATYEKVADSTLELKPAEKTLETLTAADVGTYVTLKDLTVVEIFDNNGAYTTPNITVEDAKGNKIQIYKAKVEKVGEGWSVKVGDKLTITASVGIYKETLQLRNTVAGEIVVNTANSQTGDIFGVFVAMMAVSGMGLTVVLKKKH